MTKGRIAPLFGSLVLLLLLASTASGGTFRLSGSRAPVNTSLPAISGTPNVGNVLTAAAGSWTGSKPLRYAYRWQACDSAGANCLAITGATSSSYTVASGDAGRRLRVKVTATNRAGSAAAL